MQTIPHRRFGRFWRSDGTRRGRCGVRADPFALALVIGAALMAAVLHPTGSQAAQRQTAAAEDPRAVAREIVILVNLQREQRGLRPLSVDPRLVADAKLHADQIVRTGIFAHVILGTRYPTPRARAHAVGYRWDALGENLAFGYPDATSAVDAWMRSPGHRSNILAADYTETGVVLAPDAQGHLIAVQTFGTPDRTPAPISAGGCCRRRTPATPNGRAAPRAGRASSAGASGCCT